MQENGAEPACGARIIANNVLGRSERFRTSRREIAGEAAKSRANPRAVGQGSNLLAILPALLTRDRRRAPSATFGASRARRRDDIGDGAWRVDNLRDLSRVRFRGLSFRVAAADLQKASVAQRQEVRYRALDDPQSIHGKIEVANDFWVQ